jgi:branched-chain amino acid transport system ATP-binding protein
MLRRCRRHLPFPLRVSGMSSATVTPSRGPAVGAETLRLSGVTVRFGGLTALSEISLSTRAGEFVGLIGPNGSGKTTMLNVIAGLVRPAAGDLSIGSVPCRRLSVHKRVHLGLARTFQRAMLFPELTVGEHLTLAKEVRSLWRRTPGGAGEDDINVAELIAAPPWRLGPHRPISELGLGGIRILELAMALIGRPKVLLLDEPLSGLDQTERMAVGAVLLDVQRRYGVTIVLIEHDVDSVLRLAERLVVLDFGVKIADGPTASIIEDPKVRQAYFGGGES